MAHLIVCFWSAGCDSGFKDNEEFVLLGLEGEKIIYVAPHIATCMGMLLQQCLQVKETLDDPWQHWYGDITGFTHTPGTNYVLRVLEENIENPPADGSSIEWIHLETLREWGE